LGADPKHGEKELRRTRSLGGWYYLPADKGWGVSHSSGERGAQFKSSVPYDLIMNIRKIKMYSSMAHEVAKNATCPRLSVGAVLINDDRVIAIGYNGAPRGIPHCKDVGCTMVDNHCRAAVHAEQNAVANAAYGGSATKGSVMFVTHSPCDACLKIMINAGVERVIYSKYYKNEVAENLVEKANGIITVECPRIIASEG
jgi:dCMP deaminase